MRRRLSYKSPSRLVIDATTAQRQDDTDRGSLWTKREIAWLKANYTRLGSDECGRVLRRSEISVRIKMCRLRQRIKGGAALRETMQSTERAA